MPNISQIHAALPFLSTYGALYRVWSRGGRSSGYLHPPGHTTDNHNHNRNLPTASPRRRTSRGPLPTFLQRGLRLS